jgi:hypothetical protein
VGKEGGQVGEGHSQQDGERTERLTISIAHVANANVRQMKLSTETNLTRNCNTNFLLSLDFNHRGL